MMSEKRQRKKIVRTPSCEPEIQVDNIIDILSAILIDLFSRSMTNLSWRAEFPAPTSSFWIRRFTSC